MVGRSTGFVAAASLSLAAGFLYFQQKRQNALPAYTEYKPDLIGPSVYQIDCNNQYFLNQIIPVIFTKKLNTESKIELLGKLFAKIREKKQKDKCAAVNIEYKGCNALLAAVYIGNKELCIWLMAQGAGLPKSYHERVAKMLIQKYSKRPSLVKQPITTQWQQNPTIKMFSTTRSEVRQQLEGEYSVRIKSKL